MSILTGNDFFFFGSILTLISYFYFFPLTVGRVSDINGKEKQIKPPICKTCDTVPAVC